MRHIAKMNGAQAVQTALDNETLGNPYVVLDTSAGTLDFNTLEPTPPAPVVETRLKITYNFESLEETPVLHNMWNLFMDAPGKAEFPDGTEFDYDPEGEYEDSTIYYTPSETGLAAVYYTFSGDTIGFEEDSDSIFGWDNDIPVVSIEIPEKVNTINQGTFAYAPYTAITIPNHALTIGYGAFSSEDGTLVSINNGTNTIPSGTTLGGGVFAYQGLEEVTIGQGVTFGLGLDDGDFGMCYSLTAVTFLDTVPPSIDVQTFLWSTDIHVYVPAGYEQTYVDAFNTDLDGSELTASVVGTGEITVHD